MASLLCVERRTVQPRGVTPRGTMFPARQCASGHRCQMDRRRGLARPPSAARRRAWFAALTVAYGDALLALVGLELFVDGGLEGVERLGADQAGAVDEEGRRPGHAEGGAFLVLGVDLGLELPRVERGLELGHVQAQLLRVLLQRRALERL